jgi:excisionase family DNA binding protein
MALSKAYREKAGFAEMFLLIYKKPEHIGYNIFTGKGSQLVWSLFKGGSMDQGCLTYTVEEAARRLGISRGSAYEAIRSNQIPHVTIGRRVLVPKVGLDALLAGAHIKVAA